ncbi:MAG: DHA2 family efflux MFS transporter permease subunit [Candidatus Rokubacteria bacterium]|nr:DHA2 family efflux MFS transporter permease subunit [Candidatus Rokubacteria bacterium]
MRERLSSEAARRWVVTVAVMFVATMQVLDTTVTNVALPQMQGSLSASVDEITWVFTSFLAANAVVLPATGWLVALLGRRGFFFATTLTFIGSSLLAGIAPSLEVLVGARVLQGLGGGPLLPLSQAILMEIFPPRQRGTAMAVWGIGVMFAPIFGPTLGGWITDNYSWRWIFYLNLPIGAVALALAWFFLPEPAEPPRAVARMDALGLGLMVLGVGALQVALDRGNRLDWLDSAAIQTLVVVGGAALVAFVARELGTADPIVDLRVLADRTFAIGTLLISIMGFGLYGSFVLLTFYLEHLLGYDALTTGWVLAPGGLGSVISLAVAGRLVNRIDPRWLVSTGAAIIAYSLHLMASLSLATDFWTVLWSRFVQGVGMGLVFVPLTTMTLAVVPAAGMANATGVFNVVRNLGGSAGIALLTTLLSRHTQAHQASLVGRVTVWDPAAVERLGVLERVYAAAGADPHTAQAQALQRLYGEVQRQAAMKAFLDDFWLLTAVFVAFVPVVWLMARPRHPAGEDELLPGLEAEAR